MHETPNLVILRMWQKHAKMVSHFKKVERQFWFEGDEAPVGTVDFSTFSTSNKKR